MKNKLPKNWVETELGEILKLKNGYAFKSKDYKEIGIPIIRISNIKQGLVSTQKSISVGYNETAENFLVKKGDVLVAMSGATTGKYGVFKENIKAYQNQRVGNLKPIIPSLISRKFIYYLLGGLKKEIEDKAYGGAQPNISAKLIETLKFNLPPKAEQERIVTKLDTIFNELETVKKSLENIPSLIKNFRQAILTQAVTGKLTENIENELILQSIRDDRKKWYQKELDLAIKNNTKKPKKIIFEINEGKQDLKKILSKNYNIAFLEEISAKKNYALKAGPFGSMLKKIYYVSKGYKIYGQEQVIKNDVNYGNYYISEDRFQKLKTCKVEVNDILISLVGTIGRVLIIPSKHEKGIINPRIVKVSLHEKVVPKFFELYLKSNIAKNIIKKMAHGGTMDVINLGILKKLPIPLPSTKEQAEIVKRVEKLFLQADKIEQSYEQLKKQIDSLPQAILAKAFKGELVEQLPTDGNAQDLLKEIQTLKASLESKPKKKPKPF